MNGDTAPIYDDKAHVRGNLDLTNAEWQRFAEPGADPGGEYVELAFVQHSDGVTYTAMRKSTEPDGTILVFTPSEWDAFVKGVRAGEFDEPW
ncbi:DUF397 domain-containing protein [Kibdelosporangium philippinense]|uniref:DUF397 domain-containing protein n=1 Tax=Kibdelosporangium philippinense TaxID=211113 RepID=A0ABS8ZJ78_9PSEU|nr:DUF397 domain-containing protein [Kibdelosporangium philippinense]MCE7007844.1 DUF397 domain-containing protein [Kibdelosporangium philippinense]